MLFTLGMIGSIAAFVLVGWCAARIIWARLNTFGADHPTGVQEGSNRWWARIIWKAAVVAAVLFSLLGGYVGAFAAGALVSPRVQGIPPVLRGVASGVALGVGLFGPAVAVAASASWIGKTLRRRRAG